MAGKANWAKMTTTTGGTSSLTLSAVSNYPTFTQAFGTGSTSVDYVIASEGLREAGTATFNGTTLVLSSRTVTQSWDGEAYGTSAIDFPTSGVEVYIAPIHQTIVSTDGTQTLTNKTLTSPTINGGTISGITDLAIADGGTGASTAEGARTNLGLGTAAVEDAEDFAPATISAEDLLSGIGGTDEDGKVVARVGDILAWKEITVDDLGGVSEATNEDVRVAAGTQTRCLPFCFTAVDGTVPLLFKSPIAGTVSKIWHQKVGSGSATLAVKIGSTDVTSLTSLSPGTSAAEVASTGANTVAEGDTINLVVSGTSGDLVVQGQVEIEVGD